MLNMSHTFQLFKDSLISTAIVLVLITTLSYVAVRWSYNIYFHPLSKYPGPIFAAASPSWHMWEEIILGKNYVAVLEQVHERYGDVVRVGPNELSFRQPEAYHHIYNNQNRWDKEYHLYHSFGEDRSSFGYLTYRESKERKDVLNKSFSAKAIYNAEELVRDKIHDLTSALSQRASTGKSADFNYAYRCCAMDIVTYLCFGKSVDAINQPDFKAPIIVAMDAASDIFNAFKHFDWYKKMIMNCPPAVAKVISPPSAGLVDLQQILKGQIADLVSNPRTLDILPHKSTIYHHLLSPEAHKSGQAPEPGSVYEEAQALMFGGGDTVGNTLMVGTYHMLKNNQQAYQKLKAELKKAWPDLIEPPPSIRDLEQLPYLNAVLKESLRMNMSVVGGLLRVVPAQGAEIASRQIPGGTIVSCIAKFVHFNPTLFPRPDDYVPERWLEDPGLDNWLISFSRGPRSCLGINLAWMELRMIMAHVMRRFDMALADPIPAKLEYKEAFLPNYRSGHVFVNLKEVTS